ncbi:retrovirus-related pol polyprotein from transposon RE2 [Citrus sinensis]|nr:retrovirus-related pol polyprotein from transposon RE2 [Citrus sinensis]
MHDCNTKASFTLNMHNILLVPQITKNLISISQLTKDNNVAVEFTDKFCFVKDKVENLIILQGKADKGLYKLLLMSPNKIYSRNHVTTVESAAQVVPLSMFSAVSSDLQNKTSCSYTVSAPCLKAINGSKSFESCDACMMGKLHRLHFSVSFIKTSSPLELLHTNLWGPAPELSSQGYRFYTYSLPTFNSNLNTFGADATGTDLISPYLDTNTSSNLPSTIPILPSLNSQSENTSHYPSSSAQIPLSHPSFPTPIPNSQTKSIASSHHMITRAKAGIFKPKAFLTSHNNLEPNTPSEALSDPNWKAAMQAEYDALIKNKTWSLAPMCLDFKVVGCEWVFRTKYNTDGSISKHKARFITKGFHQTAGVDYSETYSPVIKSSTIRVILSLAVMQGWKVRQIDINNAFLNGDLTKDVYMTQPEGFIVEECYVCKFNKAFYGLKQAPRAWYDKLKHCLTTWHFYKSKVDTYLFIKHDTKGLIIVLIYVDDILVTSLDSSVLEEFVAKLSKVFALKDLGLLAYFLGVEVCYTHHGMHLSQTKYIKDLLSRASMQDCKGTDTPFSTGLKLERQAKGLLGQEFENSTLYRSIVGGLQYLVLTRLDIAYSVHKLNQYLSSPTIQHWLAYWACDIDDRKSIGAYCIYLGNNLISWSSKKQGVVTKSSTESEYRALSSACSELSWLQSLFSELNITQDKVLSKELEVRYILTEEQVADILTKPLSLPKFSYFRSKLNVINRPLSLREDVKEAHLACSMISEKEDKAKDCSNYSTRLKIDDLAVQVVPGGYVITSTREDSF